MGVSLETGEHYLEHLDQFDVIFKSAGVPYSPELLQYQDKILTQMQFFFRNYQERVIAITGSKGKSTMTSLIFSILQNRIPDISNEFNSITSIFEDRENK